MAKEQRLIDANDAVRLLRGKCVAKYPNTFLMGLLAAASEIEQAPTVDAVPVVRCKDCKHWDEQDNIFSGCRCTCWKGIWDYTKADDFCSHGERRTDNERKAD